MRHWVAAAAGLVTVACVQDSGLSFAVSDSAGVDVVASRAAMWDSGHGWSLDPNPVLQIGLTEGDEAYLFEDIRGIVMLNDGRIVVADGLTRQLRFFDPQGAHLRTAGGLGEGPGEFGDLAWVDLCGDGLYAFDRRQHRVSIWSLDGDLVQTFPLLEPDGDRVPYRSACGPDGRFVIAGWGGSRQGGQSERFALYQQEAPLWLIDPRTDLVVKLGNYISSERVFTTNPVTGGRSTWSHPFGRAVVFTLDRERLFIGNSERLQVEVRNQEGKLLRILRGPDTDLMITPEHIEQYRSLSIARSILRDQIPCFEAT